MGAQGLQARLHPGVAESRGVSRRGLRFPRHGPRSVPWPAAPRARLACLCLDQGLGWDWGAPRGAAPRRPLCSALLGVVLVFSHVRHPAATWLLLNSLRHRTSVRLVFGGSRTSGAPRPLYFDVVSGASTAFASPTLPGSRDQAWAGGQAGAGPCCPLPRGHGGPGEGGCRSASGSRLWAGSGPDRGAALSRSWPVRPLPEPSGLKDLLSGPERPRGRPPVVPPPSARGGGSEQHLGPRPQLPGAGARLHPRQASLGSATGSRGAALGVSSQPRLPQEVTCRGPSGTRTWPPGGAGSPRSWARCFPPEARAGSPCGTRCGAARQAHSAPQPCSVGAVTPGQALRPLRAHAPVRAEGGPRPSRAHSRVRHGGRGGQAVPGHSACVVPTVPRANGLSSPKSPGPRVGSPGGASPGPTSGPLHWGGRARRPGGGGRTAAPAGPPLSTTLTGGWGSTTPAEHALWGAAPGTRGEVTVTESPARR